MWDTEYLAAAAAELAWRGQPVHDAAWSHITPLHWAHIHLVGHYHGEEPESGAISTHGASSATKATSTFSVNFRQKANGRPARRGGTACPQRLHKACGR